ncbi:Secreted RxLR effector peptide protein [Phytophthora cinnamomi]|uniref:Secreted RxLR effector peptide protein n=1 Tax=Phytophthora cinnamomi TaxID=4785 RepID=UPI002A27E4E0|nr:Secreted RxLR effector peptide protein [Phytophthora cinnamomi]KAJ8564189.1 hypothetical protein ON010_g7159 [Phytophthora cinnamomi]
MRLLRSHDNNEEERAGVLDKITELAKAGASKVKEGAAMISSTLRNSRLETLSEYVKMFNNKYPESKITVTGALSAKYGDDVVATALASAQSSTQNKKVADEMKVLQKEQQQVWFKEGKSADDVVNLLKLREGGYEVLSSQKMKVLEDYIKYMNRKSPHPTTLLDALTNGLGGESKLLTMLTRAKKEVRTMKEAKKLEALLLQKWLAKDELPEKVFKMLKLDNDHSYAFRSDNLNVFRTYVLDFNKKNPSQKFSTIKILTASYNEVEVVHALAAKVMVRGDDTANLLLGEQLLGWFKSDKTVDDVYALLKLPRDGTAAFVNWKLETMTAYIKLLNRHDLDESLIKTLLKLRVCE